MAEEQGLPFTNVQHHEAHIAAVLAENDMLHTNGRVLGAVWDGTGYGHDGQIWGGEFFLYENYTLQRCGHLAYFPVLLGDKMSREPRLSALALCYTIPEAVELLRSTFTDTEWNLYTRMLQEPAPLRTSSMGRLLDGIACLLGLATVSNYEGEAAMLLQATAERCLQPTGTLYPLTVNDSVINWKPMLRAIVHDLKQEVPIETIAYAVHASLAAIPAQLAEMHRASAIACSGGVWQNSLLADMLVDAAQSKYPPHFHRQFSPNDECIAYGQLAWYNIQRLKDEQGSIKPKEQTNFSATTEFTT
jgi:hydrogenase maturation protein HypF